jgi:ribonuclease-3
MEAAQRFILGLLEKEVQGAIAGNLERNHKSEFQQLCQKRFGESPRYIVLSSSGPDHNKTFEVCAAVGNRHFVAACGPNKKIAEQRAAGNAMAELAQREVPFPI